jgi:hypothetical protein
MRKHKFTQIFHLDRQFCKFIYINICVPPPNLGPIVYKFIHLCYLPISLNTYHKMVKVFRQSRRKTSLRRRLTALSANESSKLQKLKREIVLMAAKAISSDDKPEEDECQEIFKKNLILT